ncbi:hypothetical protein [Malaciobacter canalis]|uniref:hypothetical protein n=1 Tax=Malaciobacter canalis TaxID=1912871 RepID=UPI00384C4112
MKKKFNLSQTFRKWHRDLGYLVIGITIVYSLSGIMLSFRDLHIFEKEYMLTSKIEKNLKNPEDNFVNSFIKNEEKSNLPSHVVKKSVIDSLKQVENTDTYIKYQVSRKKDLKTITYYKNSGEVIYSISAYPTFIKPFIDAHKSSSKDKWLYLSLAYSVILFFLAISAIFMVKGKNGFRQRGVYLTLLGVVLIAFFLYI